MWKEASSSRRHNVCYDRGFVPWLFLFLPRRTTHFVPFKAWIPLIPLCFMALLCYKALLIVVDASKAAVAAAKRATYITQNELNFWSGISLIWLFRTSIPRSCHTRFCLALVVCISSSSSSSTLFQAEGFRVTWSQKAKQFFTLASKAVQRSFLHYNDFKTYL